MQQSIVRSVAVTLVVLVAAGCSSSIHAAAHQPASPPPAAASSTTPANFPSSSPSSTDDLNGPLGTTFTDDTTDQSGNTDRYDVTAVKVLDPARGSDEFETPSHGNHFVGVKFTITGDKGYASDDANSDAVIQGSDGQTYTPDFSSLSVGTNFNSGDFGVTPGKTESGWVTFQLPNGVSVASVQWAPGLSQPATWTP